MRYRHSVGVALARAYSVLLQGTWFWQAGFVLYSPLPGAVPWRQDDHEQMMVVTMMFAWHMAGVFVVMLCIGAVVAACHGTRRSDGGSVVELPLLRRNGDTPSAQSRSAGDLDLDSDDDSVHVDFTRPTTTSSVRHADDVTQ